MGSKLAQMMCYHLLLLPKDIRFNLFRRLTNKFILNMFFHIKNKRLDYRHYGSINRGKGETNIDYTLGLS